MKVIVQCTLIVEVELNSPDPEFAIEENSCPGTGVVGRAIDDAIAEGEKNSTCWACNLHGTNKILEITP